MQNNKDNVAYDLSLFEERKPRVVPVKKKPDIEERYKKSRNAFKAVKIFVAVSLVLAFSVMLLFNQAQMSELTTELTEYKAMLKEAENDAVHLQLEFEKRVSAKNVEEYAKNELGMQKMEAAQIERIYTEEGDKVELSKEDDGGGFFGFISKGISKILSYLS